MGVGVGGVEVGWGGGGIGTVSDTRLFGLVSF